MIDNLYLSYVERRARCHAVVVTHDNVWDVARDLMMRGYEVNIRSQAGALFLEAKNDEHSFVADIENGDAIKGGYGADVEYIPGTEFRQAWERDFK